VLQIENQLGRNMDSLSSCQPDPLARLVLLGRSGFLGKALQETAKVTGIEIVALGRPGVDLTCDSSVKKITSQLSGNDQVLMLSALTPEHGPAEELYPKNLKMMKNASHALQDRGFAHLVYLSSDAVYPWTEDAVSEQTPIAPADGYSRMHAERESIAASLGEQCGRPVGILRPCAVHGPGDTHMSYGPNRFVRTAVEEREIVLFGRGEEIRPHLWIEDCVNWILEASRTKFAGVLNIVPRETTSFLDLAHQVASLVDTSVSLRFVPRRQAIMHRRFSPSKRELLWPNLPATDLSDSLRMLVSTEIKRR
jgi:UDP-glucose 4-epimerase